MNTESIKTGARGIDMVRKVFQLISDRYNADINDTIKHIITIKEGK